MYNTCNSHYAAAIYKFTDLIKLMSVFSGIFKEMYIEETS